MHEKLSDREYADFFHFFFKVVDVDGCFSFHFALVVIDGLYGIPQKRGDLIDICYTQSDQCKYAKFRIQVILLKHIPLVLPE